jgi:hypothetical protein
MKGVILTVLLPSACFLYLILSSSAYPWGEQTYEERAAEILDAMRSNLNLEITDPTIVKQLESSKNSALRLTDFAGDTWLAYTPTESTVDDEDDSDLFDIDTLNSKLFGVCAVLPNEYWNYEWCHHKEVRQFHMDHKDGKWFKSPEWSLGKYKRTVIVRDLDVFPSPIVKVHKYIYIYLICYNYIFHFFNLFYFYFIYLF